METKDDRPIRCKTMTPEQYRAAMQGAAIKAGMTQKAAFEHAEVCVNRAFGDAEEGRSQDAELAALAKRFGDLHYEALKSGASPWRAHYESLRTMLAEERARAFEECAKIADGYGALAVGHPAGKEKGVSDNYSVDEGIQCQGGMARCDAIGRVICPSCGQMFQGTNAGVPPHFAPKPTEPPAGK